MLKADPDSSPQYDRSYNLGPTGLRGWIYVDRNNKGQQGLITDLSRQILVTHVGASTPALGVLAVDDVILGVDWGSGGAPVPPFSSDCRKSFGEAIGEAEKTENNGTLRLRRWRADVITDVQITLPIMGTYTDTAPYNCPKSALILANAIPVLELKPLTGGWKGAVGALALLSVGDPTHGPALEVLAHSLSDESSTLPAGRQLGTWNTGYEAVFLAEYYLATGDAYVLPGVHNYTVALSQSQSMYGTFGHKGAQVRSDGRYNGSIPWYGPVNSAGLVANIGIAVGKKAIVASGDVLDPEIDPAIARAANFFSSYVNRGGIPYGEHEPYVYHADNGKSGMAAVMFALMGDKPTQTDYFARISTSTHVGEEYGHTGQGFSFLWTALGANSGGPEAGTAFLKEVRWHRDLARRSDGSFAYDGSEQYGPSAVSDYWSASSYYGLSPTATYVLQYALPLKNLCITGKGANPALALSTVEVDNAIWAGRFSQEASGYPTNELVDALGEYDPVVRKSAATELGARTGEHATLLPQLIVMAEDLTDANKRQGACEALGYMGTTEALPALTGRLSDPDPWVRGRAAEALGRLGSSALPELTTMLTAFVDNATDPNVIVWDDPLHNANAYLSKILFQTQPFRTEIQNEDTAPFYSALRVGLKQPDGRARGHLSNLIKQDLSWDDVQAVASGLVEAVVERSPADQMFSDGIRYAGLETLAKFKIEEGIPLCLLVKEQTWHSDQWKPFEILRDTYGTAASEVLPSLYDWQGHLPAFAADGSISNTRYDNIEANLLSTIAVLEADTPAPALNYFKTVNIVSSTPVDFSSVQLSAAASDLDGGVSAYIWSRVSGPGTVSFSQNGTTDSASTVATFDTPGTHVLQVAVADRSILFSGIWNKTNLGYVDFQTYEHNYGLAYSSEESVVITPGSNWPPVAYAQEVVISVDTPKALTLLGFDYDGDALSYSIVTPPAQGTLSGTPPEQSYTPAPGYGGGDSFTFIVTDSNGASSAAETVSIAVRNPLAINVNFDTATRTGLVGPAGGLGKTWNQPLALSASGLEDADGLVTGVAFVNTCDGIDPWSGSRSILIGGARSFGWSTPRSLVISGLAPGGKYNLSIPSFYNNENGSTGIFTTDHVTSNGQMQNNDNGGGGGNSATWVQGENYVLFEDVEPDRFNKITIEAVGVGGNRAVWSGFQLVELPTPPPAKPAGLAAVPGDGQVMLTWNTVPGASAYLVKRASAPSGPYTIRANPATTQFLDAPATNGATWYYVVSAVDTHGESLDSAMVSATPVALVPPEAPTDLMATAGDALVALSWNATATATSYQVMRGIQPGGPYLTVANPTTTNYQDASALNGMTWYYVVSAVNSAGEGADSVEVSALPRAVTMVVHVNMYASNGGGLGTPATLEGPAGGLNETWNQFNTTTGGSVLDSTNEITPVGYTLNTGLTGSWGEPDLKMLHGALSHFGKGNDTDLTVNGLTAGRTYNVWIASYQDTNAADEQVRGNWSTINATTTVGLQTVNSWGNLNGSTRVNGQNYVLFENVVANGSGEIALLGDAYDGNSGNSGETAKLRLHTSGFQLWEFGAEPPTPFRIWTVDPSQGLTLGVNDGPHADPDGDGLANLLEFVLGGHPMETTSGILPTAGPGAGSGWVYEYDRSDLSAPPATTQVVEFGSDLLGWTEVPIPVTSAVPVTITPGASSDHVSVALPDLGPTGFARLKVTE